MARAARGQRATAPARPVNREEREDRSATEVPDGSVAGGVSKRPSGEGARRSGGPDHPAHTPGPHRRRVPPDDRLTTIIPAVRDDASRDTIKAVKAALDSDPITTPLEPDPFEAVKAALDGTVPP